MIGWWWTMAASATWAVVPDSMALCYPSGFKVAAIERTSVPVVGMAMVVSGGSSAERASEHGVAHLTEHLWFRSTVDEGLSVAQQLERVGAVHNAHTTLDETVYVTVGHRRLTRALLSLEATRLEAPLHGVDDAVFDVERDVVHNESRDRYNGAEPLLTTVLNHALREDHPYARSVIGTTDSLDALTLDDALAYTTRQYQPGQATLYLAGSIDLEAIPLLIAQSFPPGLLAHPSAPRNTAAVGCGGLPLPPDVEQLPRLRQETHWTTVRADVERPVVVAAWVAGVGFTDGELADTAAELMEEELSRRDVEAGCGVTRLKLGNVLTCLMDVPEEGHARTVLEPTLDKVSQNWGRPQERTEIGRIRSWVSSERAYRRRLARQRAIDPRLVPSYDGFLARRSVQFHRANSHLDPIRVGTAEVLRFGQQWLRAYRAFVVKPLDDADRTGADWHIARGLQDGAPAERDEVADEAFLRQMAVDPPLAGLSKLELGNGTVAWTLPMPSANWSRLSLRFAHDGDATSQILAFAALTGPFGMDPTRPGTLTAHATSIEALFDALPPPRPTAKKRDYLAFGEALATVRADNETQPSWIEEKVIWEALSAGMRHPFLHPDATNALRSTPFKDAKGHIDRALGADGAVLVAMFHEHVDNRIGSARAKLSKLATTGAGSTSIQEPRPAAKRAVVLVDDPSSVQAQVTLSCHIRDERLVTRRLIPHLLRTSLFETLRDQLGAVYDVHPDTQLTAHGLTLQATTSTPPAMAPVAIRSLLAGVDDLAAEQLSPASLAEAKRREAMRSVLRWQTVDDVMSFLEDAIFQGADVRDYDLASELSAIRAADLAASVAPCRGHEIVTVLGPTQPIAAALTAAGMDFTER
ncbi:MAG: insulinase family protein [Myxococcales bacterium]|nr:insulinase family protein [Myxococcales bacterium]